jgi:hypothetical protein
MPPFLLFLLVLFRFGQLLYCSSWSASYSLSVVPLPRAHKNTKTSPLFAPFLSGRKQPVLHAGWAGDSRGWLGACNVVLGPSPQWTAATLSQSLHTPFHLLDHSFLAAASGRNKAVLQQQFIYCWHILCNCCSRVENWGQFWLNGYGISRTESLCGIASQQAAGPPWWWRVRGLAHFVLVFLPLIQWQLYRTHLLIRLWAMLIIMHVPIISSLALT